MFSGGLPGQTATAGTLSFNPSTLSFGSVNVGSSNTISVTVSNSAGAPLTITSAVAHGTGFTISGLTVPHLLVAGGSATVSVSFTPGSGGLDSGYITFGTSLSSAALTYALSGTGISPGKLAAIPANASFGSVVEGTTNSQTIQLKNAGGQSLTISSETTAGTGFKLSGLTVPLTLGPGQTKNVTAEFVPLATGSATGSLTLRSNASDPSLIIALSGTGVAVSRTLSLSATIVNFGNEVVGGTSTQTVTVKNTGNSSVTVSAVTVSGTGFTFGGGLTGTTIGPGQTWQLPLIFAPVAAGSFGGRATISSNAGNSPGYIAMGGMGVKVSSHSVVLAWSPSTTTGVVGYNVYRSTTSGGAYEKISTTLLAGLGFIDGTVNSGTTYYYVVTSELLSGAESAFSEPITATIP
jgi:hypothetical protein